jgi:hypothetical protein
VSQLGVECCHLAGEVLDPLHKCDAVGEWRNARERRLGCGLDDAVCTAARGVQVSLRLVGENVLYVGGSRLDQMLRRKSSSTSGARVLSCLRNWDGLRSPISSVRK